VTAFGRLTAKTTNATIDTETQGGPQSLTRKSDSNFILLSAHYRKLSMHSGAVFSFCAMFPVVYTIFLEGDIGSWENIKLLHILPQSFKILRHIVKFCISTPIFRIFQHSCTNFISKDISGIVA
jgi:hypothetical protein